MKHTNKLFSVFIFTISLFITACGGSSVGGDNGVSKNGYGDTAAATVAPGTLVFFKGGTFTMGWDGLTPQFDPKLGGKWEHTVTLSDFYIENTEVTQAQYQSVMGSNPSKNLGENLPVEQVTWQNAVDYCAAIGRKLPTEAQWEYAAKNGGTSPVNAFAYGSTDTPTCSNVVMAFCSYGSNFTPMPKRVASLPASDSGLYNMAGNVQEWVEDAFMNSDGSSYHADGQVDPVNDVYEGTGWRNTTRVVRGGSFMSPYVEGIPSYHLHAAQRVMGTTSDSDRISPLTKYYNLGFRCASN